jgi:arsenate reductase
MDDAITVAFVCRRNAGRSQMATAFAERALARRGATDRVRLLTGGVDPADAIHENVVDAMAEVGVDLSGRTPRAITSEDVARANYVVTMGCSVDDRIPSDWAGEHRDWDLADPGADGIEGVRRTRDEIRDRVEAFFDDLLAAGDDPD